MSEALLPEWRDDWALFLDVDGTLLEIAETPTAVRVPEQATRVLAGLQRRLHGAVALVSGRSIAELDGLFVPLRLPTAGVHGAERRDASGTVYRRADGEALAPARELLAAWSSAHAGVLVEDKGVALALHYRGAPELETAARRIAAQALAAVGPAFCIQEGKKVLEIKTKSNGKGDAIAAFMREPPFHGRVPVFIGDDLTDEDGFDVVNRFGGHSIGVGLDRKTSARWQIRSERDVLSWLERPAPEGPA
jgi:trehalose 6-phosphate phosphatase